MMDLIEDESLRSIRHDNEVSFEEIYRQYWSKLYIYAFNVLRERELCEDIVQEVFIDLWGKKEVVEISDLSSYLYQSVKYQIFNHFRRSKYKKQLLMRFDLANVQDETEEVYDKQEVMARIKNVISKLPKRRRIIFEMSKNEGLSNNEISEKLGISLQTVKNQISESLKFIRKSLSDFYLLFF